MEWLWRDLLIGWVCFFLLPKAIVWPIFRGMWRSMKATEQLDERDRIWLEEQAARGEDDGDTVRPYPRRRGPRPGGPGPIRRLFRREAATPRTPRARR